MGIKFNADEIFEIAEKIERNGAAFYQRAAEVISAPKAKATLLELAKMEQTHEQTFTQMRRELSGRECAPATFDPEGLTGRYIKALADGRVFNYQADPMRYFTQGITMEEVLLIAIGLEKDSIIFYMGLKGIVPAELGKAKIDSIIHEEMKHITILNQELASLLNAE
ncbi:MAG: ferritin family protein [Phycisphaerae bacterium]|jgi:rubrerythrin|nr:ferritin family protein [Phycisphaerae bacterium]